MPLVWGRRFQPDPQALPILGKRAQRGWRCRTRGWGCVPPAKSAPNGAQLQELWGRGSPGNPSPSCGDFGAVWSYWRCHPNRGGSEGTRGRRGHLEGFLGARGVISPRSLGLVLPEARKYIPVISLSFHVVISHFSGSCWVFVTCSGARPPLGTNTPCPPMPIFPLCHPPAPRVPPFPISGAALVFLQLHLQPLPGPGSPPAPDPT